MKNSNTSKIEPLTLFSLFIACIFLAAGSIAREKALREMVKQEVRRQEVREAEIQKERLMIQAGCNKDKVKSVNYAEICRINDMNLGGNRGQ